MAAPWPRARLERSDVAERLGLDNSIPPGLYVRARGLGQLAAWLEADGERISSAYRSPDVTLAIYEERAGQTLLNPPSPGKHAQCLALDVAGARGVESLEQLRTVEARVRASRAHPYLARVVLEGAGTTWAHAHLEIDPTRLDALGASLPPED